MRRFVHGLIHDTQAVCDAPAALFGVELAAAYPEAKIVILNREIDPWYKSCLNTIQEIRSSVSVVQVILLILDWGYLAHYARCIKKMQKEALGFEWPEEDKAKAFFHNYYKECREQISKERVLEYKVQDGWGPLCKHLGVEVPMMQVGGREQIVPFPRVNDAVGFKESVGKILKVSRWRAYRNAAIILGVFVGLGFISWKWRPSW
jgi:Sulfotransferase domain